MSSITNVNLNTSVLQKINRSCLDKYGSRLTAKETTLREYGAEDFLPFETGKSRVDYKGKQVDVDFWYLDLASVIETLASNVFNESVASYDRIEILIGVDHGQEAF